jgi:hypothetical protein
MKVCQLTRKKVQQKMFMKLFKSSTTAFIAFWFYLQINKPLDRAVWWIEHIMRHPTLYSRRSPVHNLAWYQYLLLDVLAFYAAIVFFFGWIIFKIFICCCCRKKSLKSKKE